MSMLAHDLERTADESPPTARQSAAAEQSQTAGQIPAARQRPETAAVGGSGAAAWSIRTLARRRAPLLALVHTAIFAAALVLATAFRFDFLVPAEQWSLCWRVLPWYLAVKLAVFYGLGAFHGWWRYVTFADLADLLKSASLSTLLVASIDYFLIASHHIPRGILALDFGLTILLFGALRASFRLVREHFWPMIAHRKAAPALVVGANRAGEALVRQMNADPQLAYRAVGFLDNNPRHHGSRLGGVPVLGDTDDVARLASRVDAQNVLVPANSLSGAEMRHFTEKCRGAGLHVKVLPPVEHILDGRVKFQVRDVDINDLLRREPVRLDTESIGRLIEGRRVLVTGAGGSIGSELCRQVLNFRPEMLILVEHGENALFFVHNELAARYPESQCVPCIANILDRRRMDALFRRYEPHIVFHAAAHKHVPMMEWNPGEAIKNNVFGTKRVADLASRHGVERFVLISTDKAVNPTSVMGTAKQLAERYIHSLAGSSVTKFMTVRFGNVLGSNGSVVPIFQEQIRRGGPVTVTHPEMRRFFMTIPEASQLVLQAMAIGKGGEIFVLDMGELVKIVDLVQDMIRLSGLSPDEIEINYTGVRPGEKLFEELRFDEEQMMPTSHVKLQMQYHRPYDTKTIRRAMREIRGVLHSNTLLRRKLRELVPEYRPTDDPGPPPRTLVATVHSSETSGELLHEGRSPLQLNVESNMPIVAT